MDDIQWFNFKDFDIESNAIQLKHFSVQQMNEIAYKNKGDMIEAARSLIPLVYEPEIPFITIDYKLFKNIDKYDHIFLTQSPGFTPESSDKLIPVILKYFTAGMS